MVYVGGVRRTWCLETCHVPCVFILRIELRCVLYVGGVRDVIFNVTLSRDPIRRF